MSNSATSTPPSPSWREVVAAGPGGLLAGQDGEPATTLGAAVLAGGAMGGLDIAMVERSVAAGGYQEVCRRVLTGPLTAVALIGCYLFAGVGYQIVLTRMWTLLADLHPPLADAAVVTAQAFSAARARLGEGPLHQLFCAHAAAAWAKISTRARRGDAVGTLFGLILVAVDGTVLDAVATQDVESVCPRPSGGLYPQVRLVTLVHCATRRVLAAVQDAITVSEQVLWDRLVAAGSLTTDMLIMADRNFFSYTRWQQASVTGAHLAWRVKNGNVSLPARLIATLPDGSHLVALREPDAALRQRRKTSGDRRAPREEPVPARLVEFSVTSRDETGKTTTSRFRVLTTLLDPQTAPAQQIAAAYAHRWAVEVTYKIIKSTVRGGPVRLRAQHPATVAQEVWALLIADNILIDHAETVAADMGLDVTDLSVTVILTALRDHLAAGTCEHCGLAPSLTRLLEIIAAAPRVDTDRSRTAPRGSPTTTRAGNTRNVTHTITIEPTKLPPAETPR